MAAIALVSAQLRARIGGSTIGSNRLGFESRMGEVINLRQARKGVARRKATALAEQNRMLHGRRKAERTLQTARAKKSQRALDQHKLETGEG